MDGVLVIDKPVGPTSHDVVARVRRAIRERRIGHTGTLDPAASGVLPLVIGRATRLARFLSAGEKRYDACIRLGLVTDTGDAAGSPIGAPYAGALPSRDAIEAALGAFRGTFLQQPPVYSAKMIDGHRSYKLARRRKQGDGSRPMGDGSRAETEPTPVPQHPVPQAVTVTANALELIEVDGERVRVRVTCSAGFYVRSLAHDLGERLGTGAHLVELRRTGSGGFGLVSATPLDTAERHPDLARAAIVPLARMLTDLASVTLTPQGAKHATHGRVLRRSDFTTDLGQGPPPWIRLLDQEGDLVGLARPAHESGALHPSVVLR